MKWVAKCIYGGGFLVAMLVTFNVVFLALSVSDGNIPFTVVATTVGIAVSLAIWLGCRWVADLIDNQMGRI